MITAFAAGVPLVGQQRREASDLRRPIVGRVLDRAVAPVADGQVVLVNTAMAGPNERPTDLVQVATDARGRFVAQILAGAPYSAWAVRRLPEHRFEISAVAEDLAAGGNCELVLQDEGRQVPVRLDADATWGDLARVAVHVVPDVGNAVLLPLDADGLVPPCPPLLAIVVDHPDGGGWYENAFDRRDVRVALPPILTIGFVAVDEATAPVAGVRVAQRRFVGGGISAKRTIDRRLPFAFDRDLGVTDARGVCTARVPSGGSLAVTAPGAATVELPPEVRSRDFVHRIVAPWRVAIDGIVGLDVIAYGVLSEKLAKSVFWSHLFRVEFDVAGPCTLLVPKPAPQATLLAILRARDRRVRAADRDYDLGVAVAELATVDHWRLPLHCTHAVDIQLLDATGGPAAGVTGRVVPAAMSPEALVGVPVFTDAAGRLAIALGEGAWDLTFATGDAWAVVHVAEDRETVRESLQLDRMGTARLRLVDGRGRPLAGRSVRLQYQFDRLGSSDRLAAGNIVMRLMLEAADRRHSDADGRIDLPAAVVPGATFLAGSVEIRPTAKDEVLEVEVRWR